MIVFLLILFGFAFYVMNTQERARVLLPVQAALKQAIHRGAAGGKRFGGAVRARNPLVLGALSTGAALAAAVGFYGLHARGLTDVRPELERVMAVEDRTARTYQAAVDQFRLGTLSPEALAGVIERTVKPELHAVRARLMTLERVPREYEPLLARAKEFLRLRDESWQLRARALNDHSLIALLNADKAERAALAALEQITLPEAR
jgi:hypothetical protein